MAAAVPTLPALECISEKKEFLRAVNVLFETAPPLSSRLLQRHSKSNFKSYDDLIAGAESIISELGHDDRLTVINAHPRIGVKPTEAEISAFSRMEQGLDKESKSDRAEVMAVYSKLETLNKEYEERHGFKFVVFVNGRSKAQIVPVLEERLKNASRDELNAGLEAMMSIARDRLKKIRAQPKL